ncbi:hypothetical protein [Streptomyces sp. NPDC002537]
MTTTPPLIVLNSEAIARDISQGLSPQDEHDTQALEDRLRALIEALLPLVEAAAENLRRSGLAGAVPRDSAVACGRRLLDGSDPYSAPETVVVTLARTAKTLLYYANPR